MTIGLENISLCAVKSVTESGDVAQLIASTMGGIQMFAASIALVIFTLAIVRNYREFGTNVGMHFVATVIVCVVLVPTFPKICDKFQAATEKYGKRYSQDVENTFIYLKSVKPSPKDNDSTLFKAINVPAAIYDSIQATLCTIFYQNGIWLGKTIRDIVYFILKAMYNGSLCFSPIFIACLCLPETKSLGVNFIMTCLGFCLMPICFLFGDVASIWLADHLWQMMGLGAGSDLATCMKTGAMVFPLNMLVASIAYGIGYAVVSAIFYIALPFLFMKLFRSGSAGSPIGLGMALMGAGISAGGQAVSLGGQAAAGVATGGASVGVTAAANAATGAAQTASSAAKAAGGAK